MVKSVQWFSAQVTDRTFSARKLLFNHVLEVSPIAVVTPVLPVALEGTQLFEIHRYLSARRSVRVTHQAHARMLSLTQFARRKSVALRLQLSYSQIQTVSWGAELVVES